MRASTGLYLALMKLNSSHFLEMKQLNNAERDAWLARLFRLSPSPDSKEKWVHHGLHLCRTCVSATIGVCKETMRQKVAAWKRGLDYLILTWLQAKLSVESEAQGFDLRSLVITVSFSNLLGDRFEGHIEALKIEAGGPLPHRPHTIIPPPNRTGHIEMYAKILIIFGRYNEDAEHPISREHGRFLWRKYHNDVKCVKLHGFGTQLTLTHWLAKCRYCENKRAIFDNKTLDAKTRQEARVNRFLPFMTLTRICFEIITTCKWQSECTALICVHSRVRIPKNYSTLCLTQWGRICQTALGGSAKPKVVPRVNYRSASWGRQSTELLRCRLQC